MNKTFRLIAVALVAAGASVQVAQADEVSLPGWQVDGNALTEVVAVGVTPWIFTVTANGQMLTLKGISQIGDGLRVDLDAPIDGGYSIVTIAYSTSLFGKRKDIAGRTVVLPSTVQTIADWVFEECPAAFILPEDNSITSLGGCAFVSSGFCGKLKLDGNVTFGAVMNMGICRNSSVEEVDFGKDITTYSKCMFQNCYSLTNYISRSLTHAISDWSMENCTALKEYHFACYPSFGSNWNSGAKKGTGVRTFIPEGNADWGAKLKAGTFTPWANCSQAQTDDYFATFGASATIPLGYTTSPYATWLLYEPREAGASLAVEGEPARYGNADPDYGFLEGLSSSIPCSVDEYSVVDGILWQTKGWRLDLWTVPQDGTEKTWVEVESGNGHFYTYEPHGDNANRLSWLWEIVGYRVDVRHVAHYASIVTNDAPTVQGCYARGTTASFSALGDGFVRWAGAPAGVDASQRTIAFAVDGAVELTPIFVRDWFYDATAQTISNDDWTFPVTASGTRLTLRASNVVVGGCNFIDFSMPVRDDKGVAYAIVSPGSDCDDCYFFNRATDGLENGIVLPATLETIPAWAFENFAAPIWLPERNAIANLGGHAFIRSGLCGKLKLDGSVVFGACSHNGIFTDSSVEEVELGKDIITYTGCAFQNCRSLTNYISHALSHTIPSWSMENCTALKEYHFACYPVLQSNWNSGAKKGTGVRTFVPRGNAEWRAKMQESTFTPWANCSDAQTNDYFTAFGSGAKTPKGYTTSPYETWLLEYSTRSGMMLIFK